MYKRTYYITVLVVVFGSSFSFYSYDVVNPAQNIVMKWLNDTYRARGQPKSAAQLDFIWSVVVSSIAVGAICGALSTKPLAEKLGRRNALIANGMLNVFGALLELFSKMISGLAPMYLMEITPMKSRGAAATCHMIVVAFADWFSLFLSLPEVLGDAQNWPVAFAFSGLPAFVLCCLLPFCPESPKFTLLARRDRVGTLDALARLVNVREGQSMFEALQREGQSTQTISAQTEENNRTPPAAISVASIGRLFRTKELRMAFLICMWVMVAQQMTGCAAVFAYSTDMFLNAGLEASIARYSTLAIGIMYFLFACSSVFFIERKASNGIRWQQKQQINVPSQFGAKEINGKNEFCYSPSSSTASSKLSKTAAQLSVSPPYPLLCTLSSPNLTQFGLNQHKTGAAKCQHALQTLRANSSAASNEIPSNCHAVAPPFYLPNYEADKKVAEALLTSPQAFALSGLLRPEMLDNVQLWDQWLCQLATSLNPQQWQLFWRHYAMLFGLKALPPHLLVFFNNSSLSHFTDEVSNIVLNVNTSHLPQSESAIVNDSSTDVPPLSSSAFLQQRRVGICSMDDEGLNIRRVGQDQFCKLKRAELYN
uniref:MFS domain-containing protein n=1 Tax=Globodera pallida TaxID=36090 RepID=A0A183C9E8_GLOPA